MLGQLIASGVAQGTVYALVALGMTVLFRTTSVLNFGYGDTFMLGAFVFYVFLALLKLPFLAAVPMAILAMVLVGLLTERLAVRPVAMRPHLIVAMMTVALSYLFRGLTRMVWGRDVLPMPAMFDFDPIFLNDLVITSQNLVIIAVTAALVTGFFVFFRYTSLGKLMQAAS